MKNKEKYAKEIVEIVCNGSRIAIEKCTDKLRPCIGFPCRNCMFGEKMNCCEATREWAESEYIEPVKISKRDRAFLECLREKFKSIARDADGTVFAFTGIAEKREVGRVFVYNGFYINISDLFNIDLPMVKWEDPEPWLIEDLKKLEVCEEYETD